MNQYISILMRDRIKTILEKTSVGLVEKDEAMRLALLAAVADESIFFLGLPGTAKSMVSRRLKSAFKGKDGKPLRYFEYLMNQFSTPDEIFGPVSLKSLESDEYKRIVEGYLPDAEIAFLDEIWKASPAIQNTLLTIINEKIFHNGKKVEKAPLKALISASNELPAESKGLEALWDRFLIRLMVKPVQDRKAFLDLVCGKPVAAEIDTIHEAISIEELEEWRGKIDNVIIPEEVRVVIDAIHAKMWKLHEERPEKNAYYISDRRWKKIVHLLRTSAFLNGRNEVDLMDCSLISHCIWNSDEHIIKVKSEVVDTIAEEGHSFLNAIDDITSQISEFGEYVEKNFFEKCPKKYKMNDGTWAYRILNPQEINSYKKCMPYYITPNYEHNESRNSGAYFDDKKELINKGSYYSQYYYILDDSFKIENDAIKWIDGHNETEYSATVEMESVKSKELYGFYAQPEPKLITIKKWGATAYIIKDPKELSLYQRCVPYFISPNYEHKYGTGAYFDNKKNLIGADSYYLQYYSIAQDSFKIKNDVITWIDTSPYQRRTHQAQIEMLPPKFVQGNKEKLQRLKEEANNKYIEILNAITSEAKKIEVYKQGKMQQYGDNLFIDTSVFNRIESVVNNASKLLEESGVELRKIQFRYDNLKSDE